MNDEKSALQSITERLEALAGELAREQDQAKAAELVQEASKLAAEAGEEADRALREAQGGSASG